MYFLRDRLKENENFIEENKADICASFQKALIDILMDKLLKAVKETGIKTITLGGGVSANSGLRNRVYEEGVKRGWETFIPENDSRSNSSSFLSNPNPPVTTNATAAKGTTAIAEKKLNEME